MSRSSHLPSSPHLRSGWVRGALALLLAGSCALAAEPTASVAFSDPSRPGTLRVALSQGEVRIRGADTPDVRVTSSLSEEATTRAPRPDGLRVIGGGEATFSLLEKDNLATLDYGRDGGPGDDHAEFLVEVPRNTAVIVQNSWGGEILVESIDGDVEVKNLNGEIKLRDLGGAAIVETMNGEIEASFTRITEGKPLSFSSMNGEIKLRLPADAAADLRLRTQNGSILTDFDEQALVTKKSALTASPAAAAAPLAPEADPAAPAPAAAPEAPERTVSKDQLTARRQAEADARRAARDASRQAAEAGRQAAEAVREAVQIATEVAVEVAHEFSYEFSRDGKIPRAPRPPRPPSIPSIAGGKVISGQLNGGGTAIQIATMNGDIIVRKRTD